MSKIMIDLAVVRLKEMRLKTLMPRSEETAQRILSEFHPTATIASFEPDEFIQVGGYFLDNLDTADAAFGFTLQDLKAWIDLQKFAARPGSSSTFYVRMRPANA